MFQISFQLPLENKILRLVDFRYYTRQRFPSLGKQLLSNKHCFKANRLLQVHKTNELIKDHYSKED